MRFLHIPEEDWTGWGGILLGSSVLPLSATAQAGAVETRDNGPAKSWRLRKGCSPKWRVGKWCRTSLDPN